MKIVLFLICLLCYFSLFAQDTLNFFLFQKYEDTLKKIALKIHKSPTDKDRTDANGQFITILEKTLMIEHSFEYPFDSLKTIGRLVSPDNKFKIYNWNLPYNNGTYEYFGFIQVFNKKTNKTELYKLTDKSSEIENPFTEICSNDRWFGALYYKIILKKVKKQRYYTLLGWDGNDNFSTKKLIDVLYFNEQGEPQFGAPIFEAGNITAMRIIFEFSKEITMSLKYEKQFEKHNRKRHWMIVFDHLAPKDTSLKGQFQHYGPDGSIDAFIWKKKKWKYIEDIDARNPKEKKKKFRKPQLELFPPMK